MERSSGFAPIAMQLLSIDERHLLNRCSLYIMLVTWLTSSFCYVHNVRDQICLKSQYYMCPVSTAHVDSQSLRRACASAFSCSTVGEPEQHLGFGTVCVCSFFSFINFSVRRCHTCTAWTVGSLCECVLKRFNVIICQIQNLEGCWGHEVVL